MTKALAKNPFYPILLSIWSLVISYLTYNIITLVAFVCFAFILIFFVNLTGGNFSFVGDIFSSLGLNIVENISIDERDLLRYWGILSIAVTVSGIIISNILRMFKVIGKGSKSNSSYLRGVVFITCLMLTALVSCFFPNAPSDARNLWPQIFIFWLIALTSYSVYLLVIRFQNFVVTKIKLT